MRLICRHCNRGPANRPRGLCWRCFYTPGVRDLYPLTGSFGNLGLGFAEPTRLLAPTTARPGTAEKVEVFADRVAGGFALWHPGDAA